MKIALVNDTFLKGRGVDTVVYELARRLGKKHEVHVLAGHSDFEEDHFKIKIIKMPKLVTGSVKDVFSFLGLSRLKKEFKKLAKEENYDVINLHHSSMAPAFAGIKNVIITWHGSPPANISEHGWRRIGRPFANKLALSFLKKNKKTSVISDYLAKELGKIINQDKIVKIYDGVGNEFKGKKNIDKGFMLFVGRHEKHKNIHELIKIAYETKFPLKLAGYGPETEVLKQKANELGAPVEFLGRVERDDLIKNYESCSFFVSTSKWEGFGLIFLEAAMFAKPSIAYNICSMPEVITHGQTGFLASNYEEFKKHVEDLVKDKKLRKQLGKNALEFAKKFSWDKIANEYEKMFEVIVG